MDLVAGVAEGASNAALFLNGSGNSFRTDSTRTLFPQEMRLIALQTLDADNDGDLDLYATNHGSNALYRNNGDLTFTEIAEQAGISGSQILMRNLDGQPIFFEDPETGEKYEGYDPTAKDRLGNSVGEPTGQTHAVTKYADNSLQSSRAADFYWSVNQTRIYLVAGEKRLELEVQLETVTPNFAHYLVKIDEGTWRESQGPLTWKLAPGENGLAVRSVNVFGKMGRVAAARVRVDA